MDTTLSLILVFTAGLCPLSFLLGVASVLIFLGATGRIGRWRYMHVPDVERRSIGPAIAEHVADHWEIFGISTSEEKVGLLTIHLRKRTLF